MNASKEELLIKLKQKMSKDDSLPLKKDASNLVFGEGSANAQVIFIGEGPGYWEDLKGRPFVGNAGAFLNQLLYSIKLPREDVFITNVVHYRPPGNRDPSAEELAAFKPYLDKIIEIINPPVVVTLGRFSMAKFLVGVTITQVHGKPRKILWNGQSLTIVPMYHPAAGLRSTEIKRRTYEDFRIIPEVLEDLKNHKNDEKKEENEIKVEQMQLV